MIKTSWKVSHNIHVDTLLIRLSLWLIVMILQFTFMMNLQGKWLSLWGIYQENQYKSEVIMPYLQRRQVRHLAMNLITGCFFKDLKQ